MRRDLYDAFRQALADDRPVLLATVLEGGDAGRQLLFEPRTGRALGTLGSAAIDAAAVERARPLLTHFRCERVTIDADERRWDVFLECHGPQPKLVLVGAVHVAIPLVHLARVLGYRTIVVDPRPVFATRARFGHADELVVEWPDEALRSISFNETTYLVVLSHDMKIDVPALVAGLRAELPYIGALGSRKTQKKRAAALEELGVAPDAVARVRSPIGLDLGGRRAEDLALAIMAEIVAVAHGVLPTDAERSGAR